MIHNREHRFAWPRTTEMYQKLFCAASRSARSRTGTFVASPRTVPVRPLHRQTLVSSQAQLRNLPVTQLHRHQTSGKTVDIHHDELTDKQAMDVIHRCEVDESFIEADSPTHRQAPAFLIFSMFRGPTENCPQAKFGPLAKVFGSLF